MRILKYILVVLFITASLGVSAQNGDQKNTLLDSLENLLSSAQGDSAKIAVYNSIYNYFGDLDVSIRYAQEFMEKAIRLNDTALMINCQLSSAYAYLNNNRFKDAEKHLITVVNLANQSNNKQALAKAYYLYSFYCEDADNIAGMVDYGNKSLEIYRQLCDTVHILDIYMMYAQSCGNMNMFKTAYEYLVRSILLSHVSKHSTYTADALVFYASTMLRQFDNVYYSPEVRIGKFKKIINYCSAATRVYDSAKRNTYYDRQILYLSQVTKAQAFLKSAEILNSKPMADSCAVYLNRNKKIDIDNQTLFYQGALVEGGWLMFNGQYRKAVDVLLKVEQTEVLHTTHLRKQACSLLSQCYSKLGNLPKTLEFINKAGFYEKLANREAASKQYADFKTKMISQTQVELIETGKRKDTIKKEGEIKRQNYITTFLVLIVLLVLMFATLILNTLNKRRRTNLQLRQKNDEITKLNGNIISQKKEIAKRRDTITMQFDVVENFNETITSNIKYAGKIQRAAIPSDSDVKRLFNDSFVLFRPKDIVSGDFYTITQKGVFKIFVVADCTGHGVPGGLLSMLGISALNDILRNLPDDDSFSPAKVLDRMRDFIINVFEGKSGLDIYDGMDMTICALDTRNNTLHFAAGNQSVFIYHDGQLIRLKGDKMPVGRYVKNFAHFTDQIFNLNHGDMVYMFSDGIQDLLGGPLNKKLLIRGFEAILAKIVTQTGLRQRIEIDTAIDLWRGDMPQIDDITVAGFRI